MLKKSLFAAALALSSVSVAHAAPQPPSNLVLILSDDLGYGDLGCYGATKVKTPNLDKLAAQGIRFTDAHSPAATCTPSRYSLLTGQYAFRKEGAHILPGDANLLIDPRQPTLPKMFQSSGFKTAAIGKWHLGLGSGTIDWNGDISPGPNEVGFDYSFIIPATGDRVPCVYVENHRVVGFDPSDPIAVSYNIKVGNEPTGKENPELVKMSPVRGHDATIINGIPRIGWMSGGKNARWNDETIAQTLTDHATKFITDNKDHPFFLYFATHDIHVPRVPGKQFAGSSECGVRGDVIQELDWSVGQVMQTLEREHLTEKTMVIFASDNGPVVIDGYADGSAKNLNGHKPAGDFRGGKYSLYEGGTRTPFVVAWNGSIKPAICSSTLSQVDLMPSFATMFNLKVPDGAPHDGMDLSKLLIGESQAAREELIEEGRGLALRKGDWKLIEEEKKDPELYNLKDDPSEKTNVAEKNEKVVKDLAERLQQIRQGK